MVISQRPDSSTQAAPGDFTWDPPAAQGGQGDFATPIGANQDARCESGRPPRARRIPALLTSCIRQRERVRRRLPKKNATTFLPRPRPRRKSRPMSDPYIDCLEILGYGPHAVNQMGTLLVGLDLDLDPAIEVMRNRVSAQTGLVAELLTKAGAVEAVTYAGQHPQFNPVVAGHDLLARAADYVKSQPGGAVLKSDLLDGRTKTAMRKLRGSKLAGLLAHAITFFGTKGASLGEAVSRKAELVSAHQALEKLNRDARVSRTERREYTPEVEAARARWLDTYVAAKHLARCVLTLHDKLDLLSEIFDDLAEVHAGPGVRD